MKKETKSSEIDTHGDEYGRAYAACHARLNGCRATYLEIILNPVVGRKLVDEFLMPSWQSMILSCYPGFYEYVLNKKER